MALVTYQPPVDPDIPLETVMYGHAFWAGEPITVIDTFALQKLSNHTFFCVDHATVEPSEAPVTAPAAPTPRRGRPPGSKNRL